MTAPSSGPRTWRARAHHLAAGGVLSLALVLGTAILSAWPVWQSLAPGMAVLRLSFTHSGARNCRDRTPEELAKLPENMRDSQVCDRRRAEVRVEMDIDTQPVIADNLPPSGLVGSGPSRVYRRLELRTGRYHLDLRMRDDPSVQGFTQEAAFDIDLSPAESLAIDFDSTTGSFFVH